MASHLIQCLQFRRHYHRENLLEGMEDCRLHQDSSRLFTAPSRGGCLADEEVTPEENAS